MYFEHEATPRIPGGSPERNANAPGVLGVCRCIKYILKYLGQKHNELLFLDEENNCFCQAS